ncbi:MAG: hypothetical protein IJ575_00040 [Selenomonadaceae bacterium]|nr:hypothetical protein [Selenomonadaceae bacterium]
MADSSKMVISSEIAAGGITETISTSFSAINPEITAEDFVACGNALGSLCRVEPDYFKRVDTTIYTPDQFEGGD